ncbi:NAC domain-containing protein 55 [Hordeum vulgare]|nr:NAC domain-containing protein 55 [Hordeum vulgare]
MAGHPELFPVGSIFDPDGQELIDHYLRRRIAGKDCGHFSSFIHDADVYFAPPGDLVENRSYAPGSDKHGGKGGQWYFSPASRQQSKGGRSGRRQRVVDDEGYNWHSEKGEIPVLDPQRCKGCNAQPLSSTSELSQRSNGERRVWPRAAHAAELFSRIFSSAKHVAYIAIL